MGQLKSGWKVKGIYNEACASEGHCPYYFGRDKEGGCRYFMVFRIKEGKVNDVDLAGVTVIYVGDLPHAKFEEVLSKGSEGGIYVGNNVTEAQRNVLDSLVVQSIGAALMKKNFGVKYVDIKVEEKDDSLHVKMPSGEMRQQLTRSSNGDPVRLENQTLPFLSNVKACHTPFWNYEDHGRHYDYKNRCGTWADFMMAG